MLTRVDSATRKPDFQTSIFGTIADLTPSFQIALKVIPFDIGNTAWRIDAVGNFTTFTRQLTALKELVSRAADTNAEISYFTFYFYIL